MVFDYVYFCFHPISCDNWKFPVTLKYMGKWGWILLNPMTDESHSHLNIPKKTIDMKEKNPVSSVLAFLFVIFSSCALIPHSEKVRSPHWISQTRTQELQGAVSLPPPICVLTIQEPKVLEASFLKLSSSVSQLWYSSIFFLYHHWDHSFIQ